jgi:hypothetical protein
MEVGADRTVRSRLFLENIVSQRNKFMIDACLAELVAVAQLLKVSSNSAAVAAAPHPAHG